MKMLLLLCLGLTLVCVHAEEASSTGRNFNVQKINGEWHTIILASDKREKIEDNGNFRLFLEQIHVLENSLVLKFHTVRDEECSELSMVADKTEKAGEYSVTYDGFNTFTIPKTDYDNFLMAHLINEKDGETFQLMGLYGREPDLSSDIKERFAQLCEKHGILRENIIDLSNAMDLVPEHVLVLTLQIAASRPENEEWPEPPVLSGDFSPGLHHHPFLSIQHPQYKFCDLHSILSH
ncbi:major urinary protein 15 isoform X1 [Mus musculus]|uniref:major urinary protein 15 isoform X1 n=1 Tax=Mus musculus TaxID=10090 RepID=UPI0001552BF1|nr:major urinary protein 15 isoform X1 [Mus musculus]|eukprot:XP_006537550.1 PREDICTED: major urinary protein 15 isoform X1 [Mus musculus]